MTLSVDRACEVVAYLLLPALKKSYMQNSLIRNWYRTKHSICCLLLHCLTFSLWNKTTLWFASLKFSAVYYRPVAASTQQRGMLSFFVWRDIKTKYSQYFVPKLFTPIHRWSFISLIWTHLFSVRTHATQLQNTTVMKCFGMLCGHSVYLHNTMVQKNISLQFRKL